MVSESLFLCGRMIIPPCENTRSTGADEAGTVCTFIASWNRIGRSCLFLCQNARHSSSPSLSQLHMVKYFWYSASSVSGCEVDDEDAAGELRQYRAKSLGILFGGSLVTGWLGVLQLAVAAGDSSGCDDCCWLDVHAITAVASRITRSDRKTSWIFNTGDDWTVVRCRWSK